jgi:hypothetical protein
MISKLERADLNALCSDIIDLLMKKNEDYGGASFDLGLNGNMVHLWDKVKRYKTIIENQNSIKSKPNFESIEDTLKDIVGYALIGLKILAEEGNPTVEKSS